MGAKTGKKAERICGLYVILDPRFTKGRDEVIVARAAIKGGARMIQWRDKVRDKGEQLPVVRELKRVCEDAGVLLIVNDHVDLAIAADADGVHVGQKDLPVLEVRRILPPEKIAGVSTALLSEAIKGEADGADYIAVGYMFPTSSKDRERLRYAGLETLRRVKQSVSVPVVAVGGINESNVDEVLSAGADVVAVISAVVSAEDVEAAARRLVEKIERKRDK